MDTIKTPKSGESLASYVVRIRKELNLTQFELANAAGFHELSVGKMLNTSMGLRDEGKSRNHHSGLIANPIFYIFYRQ